MTAGMEGIGQVDRVAKWNPAQQEYERLDILFRARSDHILKDDGTLALALDKSSANYFPRLAIIMTEIWDNFAAYFEGIMEKEGEADTASVVGNIDRAMDELRDLGSKLQGYYYHSSAPDGIDWKAEVLRFFTLERDIYRKITFYRVKMDMGVGMKTIYRPSRIATKVNAQGGKRYGAWKRK